MGETEKLTQYQKIRATTRVQGVCSGTRNAFQTFFFFFFRRGKLKPYIQLKIQQLYGYVLKTQVNRVNVPYKHLGVGVDV